MTPDLPNYDFLPPARGESRSAWRLFGDADSVGLLNLQTPERVAAAARLVGRGAVFPLSAPMDVIEPPMFERGQLRRRTLRRERRGLDDVWDNFYPQSSSHWDALGHVAFENDAFYNGATLDDVLGGRNTIDHFARRGIAGRAVLLDVRAALEEAGRPYDPGSATAFTVEDLELTRRRAGVDLRPGDVLLLRTGFREWYVAQSRQRRAELAAEDGLRAPGVEHSEAMARYLWNAHVSALAADCPSVEVWPRDGSPGAWPFGFLHRILIGQFGMALGEQFWLRELAEDCASDGVYEMFFTAAPLNVVGGIGSPANALAIK